jgi:UDP-glucose 4-epimerase
METRKQQVLVVGGAGYIGSHMVERLKKSADYVPIVLDNLTSGTQESIGNAIFFKGDASNEALIEEIYDKHPFTSIIHFAAFIQVGESVNNPLKYYDNNVVSTVKLLHVAKKLNVKNIVFSSSAAIYEAPESTAPIKENHTKFPINPYGRTKWMLEQILQDCCHAYEMNVVSFRYFNVAGGNPDIFAGKRRVSPTNLIPVVLQAALKNTTVKVFGNNYPTKDGTGIRDYIDVEDLCDAHYCALGLLARTENIHNYRVFNLGTGTGHSVLEVIEAAREITGEEIPIQIVDRRPGDSPMMVADPSLARKELNWEPQHTDIKTIIARAWLYELKRCGKEHKSKESHQEQSSKLATLDASSQSNRQSHYSRFFKPAVILATAGLGMAVGAACFYRRK